jgi:hypothetical protein
MSHPCFYGDIINKAKKLKSDTCKNLICKGYDSTTICIVDCLMLMHVEIQINIMSTTY